jgi:hypothetical protein
MGIVVTDEARAGRIAMAIPHNAAQMQFERNKDDKRTQALLALLGKMRERVIDWDIHVTTKGTTYKVVFQDGKEMRGFIIPIPEQYDWQHCGWIASGTIIPADPPIEQEIAELERAAEDMMLNSEEFRYSCRLKAFLLRNGYRIQPQFDDQRILEFMHLESRQVIDTATAKYLRNVRPYPNDLLYSLEIKRMSQLNGLTGDIKLEQGV